MSSLIVHLCHECRALLPGSPTTRLHRARLSLEYGRIETRKIWGAETLNDYLDFPYFARAFAIKRESIDKKAGTVSKETAFGISSQLHVQAKAQQVLKTNRKHWGIESHHSIID